MKNLNSLLGQEQVLSFTEKFVKTLFLPDTVKAVSKQFKSNTDIVPIDAFETSFRLLKTNANTINLEYLVVSSNSPKYFKPVGFYTNNLTLTVLNEYQADLSKLKERGDILKTITINTLDLKSEAVIAAFSMETI